MPELSGLDFLAQVKNIQPEATRILMTGVLELDTIINSINTGEIFRFVIKPWLRPELVVTIKNGVQRYELITRNAELYRTTVAMNEELAGLNRSLEQRVAREAEQNRQLAALNHALERNLHRSVELCLKTLQTFYPSLGAQARRACELCTAIAEGLQMPPEQRQVFEVSALLHDIGLVGIPRRIIHLSQTMPEALNDAEWALIEQHPILGQELAGFVHHLADVGVVIRSHHERFDGQGYPDQLSGENIPWLARLLAVVTYFGESDGDPPAVVEAAKRGSGSRFDPEAVRIVIRHRPQTLVQRKEREVLLSEIQPGMVLAKGIYTANGLLLIPGGQVMSGAYIDKLKNHNRISPIKHSLLVYG
jgi:response regulator RpfG family c-di-GMP phosphodiesterase